MKTMSSKLRKAGMETIAVIAVLVATCLTISAQGAKFDNNELNGTTLAMAEKSEKFIQQMPEQKQTLLWQHSQHTWLKKKNPN
jgi:hypothetical protein